jgi:autotransporter adhesin
VTAGAAGTDAVNVNQLNAAIASVSDGGSGGGIVANAVTYNDSAMGLITLKGSAGTKITNLTAGDISSAWSTDAVNGSQLYQTNQNVANVAGTVANVAGNLTNITNTVNNIVNNGIAGSPLVVLYDSTARNSVTLGGAGSATPVKLTNVAAGDISSDTSTDAVNGAQLRLTNQNISYVEQNVEANMNAWYTHGIKYFHTNSTLADSSATGTDSVAIGGAASATMTNAVALGSNSVADRANAVSVGAASAERQIINVAAGTSNTDAVNVQQLNTAIANVSGGGSPDAVIYDSTTHNKLTLGGTSASAPVALTNVAAGQVTSASKDAINGAQLFGTANSVATALGGGSAVNANGALSAPAYALSGTTYNDVGSALAAVNAKAGSGSADGVVYDTSAHRTVTFGGVGASTPVKLSNVADGIANNDAVNVEQLKAIGANIDSSGNVTGAFVAYDSSAKSKVTLGGAGATSAVGLTNVAAGKITSSSTDAVNGSQLYNTANSVAAALGGGTSVSPTGTVTAPTYALGNTGTFSDVGSALSGMNKAIDGINGTITNTTKYIKVVSVSSAAIASGSEAVAIGGGSYASKVGALAIGSGARAINTGSVAIGSNSVTTEDNTISVGSEGGERRIMNVADGQLATDVATVGQLDKLQAQLARQSSGVRSMLLGATSATDFIAVSPSTTAGAKTTTDNSLDAMAIGPGATGMGAGSVAIGAGAGTSLGGSTAVGSGAAALALNSTVIGASATTANFANNAVAIGYRANAQNTDALAIGSSAIANGTSAVSLGNKSFVAGTATSSMALGAGTTVSHAGSVALGAGSATDRANSIAVGSSALQRQITSVAAGTATTDAVNVSQLKGVTDVIGGGAGVSTDGTIKKPAFTVGGQTYTDVGSAIAAAATGAGGAANSVQYDTSAHTKVTLGGTGASTPVTLSNVAAGVASNDAVNVTQLKAMGGNIDSSGNVTNAFVAYDDTTKNAITLKGANGSTKITALTAGALSATSTDAVNGTQLFQTNQNVANVAGGVTNITNVVNNITNGNAGVKYFHVNSTLADSSATGSNALAVGPMASSTVQEGIAIGYKASVTGMYSVALGSSSVADRANTLSVGSSTFQRQIVNMAAGTAATDAVNVSQLKGVTDAIGGGAGVNTDGSIKKPAFAVGGQTYTDVGSALAAAVTGGSANSVQYDTSAHTKVTLGGTGASTPVTLSNVGAGVANNDAVNVAQLKAMGGNVDSSGNVTNAFVAYDDTTKNTITLKGAGSTKITALTAGALSATSTDAVNGTQLFQTNQNVANVAGGVTNITNVVNNITNGNAGVKYFHVNSTLADSSATGTNAVAIGGNASATGANSVALGSNSVAARANSVDVGSRQITDVAAGTQSTDAVNLAQLQAMGANVDSSGNITNAFVSYDDTTKNAITLKGASGSTKISGIAAGAVSASSTEALNGSQLYNTANSVTAALGGGSSVSPTGTVTKPNYKLSSGTYTDVGSALSGIDGAVSSINNNIAETTKYIKVVSVSSAAIASGSEAVAIGGGAYASKVGALAIGSGARAINAGSMALGVNSVTTEDNTISVGSEGSERRIMNVADGQLATDVATVGQLDKLQAQLARQSSGVRSMLLGSTSVTDYIAVSPNTTPAGTTSTDSSLDAMAIGPGATGMGAGSVAIGAGAATSLAGSTSVGSGSAALALNTTVIGADATTNNYANNAVAIGYKANAQNTDALAIGSATKANAVSSVALGSKASVAKEATNSMALGAGTTATHIGSVALGANSATDRDNSISVGSSSVQRQIVNVAAGTAGTDAVNVSQMNAAIAASGGSGTGSPDAVVYDTSTHTKLTLGGTSASAPVALTNVAAGQVTSSSKDAINGAQLYNTANSVATALGGGSGVNTDGTVKQPAYTLNGSTYSDVGAALAAVNAKAGTGSTDGVAYDNSAHTQVTFGGAGSTTPVTLANVADGVANNDAVNVKQLKAMGANIDSSGNVSGAFVAYDDSLKNKVTFGGLGSTTPVTLTNVAAGQITSSSKDAINGSQLYGTASSVAAALGGSATVGTDGKVSKPSYSVGGNTYNGVDAALAALDAKSTTGSPDGVVYDTSVHDQLTLGNKGKPVTVANVADAKNDNEAVNLKQLKDAGLSVDTSGNVTNAFVAYDNADKKTVTFGGFGSKTPVQLKNVAVASDLTDAVNFGQMQTYVADHGGSGGGTANAVAYDDSNRNTVTLGGAGHDPVTLTNIAAGANGTDAVNYSQFSSLQNQVNNLAGGGVGDTTYVNINTPASGGTAAVSTGTDAIAIGNGAVASGTAAIAIGKDAVTAGDNSVAMGQGASAPNANAVALGSNSTTDRDNSVSVGSAGNERQITNVAAGTQTTDAVNLGQLNNAMGGMQQSIHNVDRSAAKGIASASALNIVTPYLPGRTTLNAGVANYRGYQAVGLGVSRWNEKGTINYNLGVSTSGGNSTIVRAGIGIVLGN